MPPTTHLQHRAASYVDRLLAGVGGDHLGQALVEEAPRQACRIAAAILDQFHMVQARVPRQ
jgi:hypothetical protein